MKLLLAGAFRYEWYEPACAAALTELGVEVVRFGWDRWTRGLTGRLEERFIVAGPSTWAMNRALLEAAEEAKPDVVLVWRGTRLRPSTLRALRARVKATLVGYNNDDPFGPTAQGRLWKLFLNGLGEYDRHFVFRSANVSEYLKAGARSADVLMPYFLPWLHRPVELNEADRLEHGCDAVFVGHYEDDGRVEAIRALMDAGLALRVRGSNWPKAAARRLGLAAVKPVYGEAYVKALCGAKLCLSFLSRLNRDAYTRRSFEIPACGGLMFGERTPELRDLFVEDAEAVYFSSSEELVAKALELLADEGRRRSIAAAGRARCLADGHDVVSRMSQLLYMLAN